MKDINNFQQEPDETLYQAWERFKELLMKFPQHYLTEMQEIILFYNGLDVPTRQILNSKDAIQAQLNNLGREIKKVNKKVYAAQVGCEQYYIKLNDLNVPLELRRDQVDDFMPIIEEGESVNVMSREFYTSIIMDKVEYNGNNVVGALMNVPIVVENFSVVTHFVVMKNMDGYRDQDIGDDTWRTILQSFMYGSKKDLARKEIDKVGEVSIFCYPMCVL
ncbi:hypothetical protein Tco_0591044 [Tanacetum coccineum]